MHADVLAEIVGDAAESTRKGENAEITLRRFRKARENFADIHQFVEIVDDDDAGMFDERPHGGVIAG